MVHIADIHDDGRFKAQHVDLSSHSRVDNRTVDELSIIWLSKVKGTLQ